MHLSIFFIVVGDIIGYGKCTIIISMLYTFDWHRVILNIGIPLWIVWSSIYSIFHLYKLIILLCFFCFPMLTWLENINSKEMHGCCSIYDSHEIILFEDETMHRIIFSQAFVNHKKYARNRSWWIVLRQPLIIPMAN